MVIWLCGLSGAGKSTIASALVEQLKPRYPHTVLVDGDTIRAMFEHQSDIKDYSLVARRASAIRMQKICQWLDSQGLLVVAASIAMFDDINAENRRLFSTYIEAHVHASIETLARRDNKGLYQAAMRGERKDVLGVDIPYSVPARADIRIENSFQLSDIQSYVDQILIKAGLETEL